MQVFRCFPWDGSSRDERPGGPFYIPRTQQGAGRYDVPDLDGVVYLSQTSLGSVAEALQIFRGMHLSNPDFRLTETDFKRAGGYHMALAAYELVQEARLINLNDLNDLARYGVQPSDLRDPDRKISQPIARRIHESGADGFLSPSNLDSHFTHLILFQSRLGRRLKLLDIRALGMHSPEVIELAKRWGIPR